MEQQSIALDHHLEQEKSEDDVNDSPCANLPLFAQEHFYSSCTDPFCAVCQAAITYVAGYFVKSISKRLPCEECVTALHHSEGDPCNDRSLILAKSYNPGLVEDYDKSKGLALPSGGVVRLLTTAERHLRSRRFELSDPKMHARAVQDILLKFHGKRDLSR